MQMARVMAELGPLESALTGLGDSGDGDSFAFRPATPAGRGPAEAGPDQTSPVQTSTGLLLAADTESGDRAAPAAAAGGWTAPPMALGPDATLSGDGLRDGEGWTGGGGWTGGDGWTGGGGNWGGGGWTGGGDGGGWTGGGDGGGWTGGGDGGGWTGGGTWGGNGDGSGWDAIPKSPPVELTLEVGGVTRSFFIDVPDSYDADNADQDFAAVFAFHGGEGNAYSMVGATDFGDYGEARDFITIYPEALDGQWNDNRGSETGGADDVGFILALIDELAANWSVDAARMFATGISNGGTFVQRMALEVPEVFAGYGVVAANLFSNSESQVDPAADVPMVFFHYTEDPAMPFDGGGANGPMMSSEETVEYWAALNDAAMGDYTTLPDIADDGMTTALRVSDDGSIQHYVTDGASHTWPGMDQSLFEIDGVTQDIEATAIMVEFFDEYGL